MVQTTLSTLTVIVLTIYLLVEAPRLSRFVFRFVPRDREADARRFQASLVRVVGGYIRGQVITSDFMRIASIPSYHPSMVPQR